MHRLLRFLFAPPNPLRAFHRHRARADAANAARDWPRAELHYAQALGRDPLRTDLWVQYGHALNEQGKHAAAGDAYALAMRLTPEGIDAPVHLGHLRKALGDREGAIAAFAAGRSLDPARDDLRAELLSLGADPGSVSPRRPPFQDVDALPVRGPALADRPAGRRHTPLERLAAVPSRLLPGGRRPPIAFLHMHKTGGLTLDDVLAARYAPARICPVKDDHLHLYEADDLARFDLFSGHFDVGGLRLLPPEARTISVFREPRARLVSFYRFHAAHDLGGRHGVNTFARMANAMGPEAFFEDERVRRAPEVFNHYLCVFALTYAQVLGAASVNVDRVMPGLLEAAIARVRRLDAIALLERFDDSVVLACAALDLGRPTAVKPRNRTDQLARQMKGRAVPSVAMTPRLAAALADLVRFDTPIYAAAVTEFEHRWTRFEQTRTG